MELKEINPPLALGYRSGRNDLAQLDTIGDTENANRFTPNKHHSDKTASEAGCKMQAPEPFSPECIPISPHEVTEIVVVGEWVSSIP